MDEAERDVEPARHAAGVGAREPVGGVGEPEAGEQLVGARARRARARAVHLALEDEVLAARRLAVGAGLLGDDADRAAHGVGPAQDVDAGHERAGRRRGGRAW